MTKARDIASAAPAPSTVSATELGYLDGVSSAIQTQIDGKQAANANVSTTELGYLDGVTSAIQTQLDGKTAKNTLTTTGDIYYASSANTPARLGIGSTGNVLTVASGVPSWAAPAGGGKVLQVVSSTTSTAVSITSTTQTDTGITATITPTANNSKILVIISANTICSGADPSEVGARVMRDATNIHNYGDYSFHRAGIPSGNPQNLVNHSITYLDSPATTSATTYKLQAKVRTSGTVEFQFLSTAPSTITLLEIGA